MMSVQRDINSIVSSAPSGLVDCRGPVWLNRARRSIVLRAMVFLCLALWQVHPWIHGIHGLGTESGDCTHPATISTGHSHEQPCDVPVHRTAGQECPVCQATKTSLQQPLLDAVRIPLPSSHFVIHAGVRVALPADDAIPAVVVRGPPAA